jgi:hypothetical protein
VIARFKQIRTGAHGRFLIRKEGESFRVHDAEAVTDAEVRRGIGSPVVFHSTVLEEALDYCRRKEFA